MTGRSFRFERFRLDPAERRLTRDGAPVELNARYLDALALLVTEAGKLVTKERFLDEVWRGVPVTDEALTQCIRTLRKQLGDDAARPQFIETVPKHGYRFVAAVAEVNDEPNPTATEPKTSRLAPPPHWRDALLLGGAGTAGAGVAGVCGGLFYGLAGASQVLQPAMGAASVLLVLIALSTILALIGGAGVSFGVAAAAYFSRSLSRWSMVGGACGGLLVGTVVKPLGIDAFNLLFGRAPGEVTGAAEGALLGGAVGLGAWLASRRASLRVGRRILIAGAVGAAGGAIIALLGGRLLGGSLDLLARRFPDSRLRLDRIGGMFGETEFGPISQTVTSALEGLLFSACIVGAMLLAERSLRDSGSLAGLYSPTAGKLR